MKSNLTYAFIGAGSMAEAIVSGMIKSEVFNSKQLIVTNRSNIAKLNYFNEQYDVHVTQNIGDAVKQADVIILAMKPKDITGGLDSIKPYVHENQLLISVIAGVSTTSMEDLLSVNIPIIRAMPNTSATIQQSATALSKGLFATDEHQKIAITLFETIGTVSLVEEKDLHAVTGLSGSGPAYIYYLIESMDTAAQELGLDPKVARELILQTIIGAAEMLKVSPKSPATLKQEVMSPGGTTEAGLKVLEQYNYQQTMIACIKRAAARSNELGIDIENMIIKQR
ncbi:pyrroline-5-carboxylate reductase ProI [Bacillus sp. Marseille-P3661]|uniref:pyrroline-5-carboxylate reductase ProI n=1 Tax=Bacillus sp. Marseille-P3661 TaxID=1936234 RepID=UPI000C831260|nr:pyrroline-5-carboxylate reductase ProI [Bacillus sp. Marseille-P3661]